MASEVIYPLLIVIGCGLFMALVNRLTRPEPTRHDIGAPAPEESRSKLRRAAVTETASEPSPEREDPHALELWHIRNEARLLSFIESVDDFLDHADATGPDDSLVEALTEAAEAHPSPEMRSELSAMTTAATSLQQGTGSGEDVAFDRHRFIYLTYRRSWIERLEQFCVDRRRVHAAATRSPGTTDEWS